MNSLAVGMLRLIWTHWDVQGSGAVLEATSVCSYLAEETWDHAFDQSNQLCFWVHHFHQLGYYQLLGSLLQSVVSPGHSPRVVMLLEHQLGNASPDGVW